jgi:hypothetical protein
MCYRVKPRKTGAQSEAWSGELLSLSFSIVRSVNFKKPSGFSCSDKDMSSILRSLDQRQKLVCILSTWLTMETMIYSIHESARLSVVSVVCLASFGLVRGYNIPS